MSEIQGKIKQNPLQDELFQHEHPYFHANEIIPVCTTSPLNTKFVPPPTQLWVVTFPRKIFAGKEGFILAFLLKKTLHFINCSISSR